MLLTLSSSLYVRSKFNQPELSGRHKAILNLVYDLKKLTGDAPSLTEIGEVIHITSTAQVFYHVQRLLRWGYLGQTTTGFSSIVLLEPGYAVIGKKPEEDPQILANTLRDENRRLRQWCEQLHRERDDLKDQLHSLMVQAS